MSPPGPLYERESLPDMTESLMLAKSRLVLQYVMWTFIIEFGLNIFISNQFIQYNAIFNNINIMVRTEIKTYQVLLLLLLITEFVKFHQFILVIRSRNKILT